MVGAAIDARDIERLALGHYTLSEELRRRIGSALVGMRQLFSVDELASLGAEMTELKDDAMEEVEGAAR